MKEIFEAFDSWEPLLKARKAKGLSKWDRLKNISEKLQGKDVKAISFTCSHPSHTGEPVKHLLGSIEGNLHFLLGYGNPSFHIAPYTWQIVDPNLTDEEAEELAARMKHPANPALWAKSGLDVGDEGDVAEGAPHDLHTKTKAKAKKDSSREKEVIRVASASGVYLCYPSEGLIIGDHNKHTYVWDLVKDSFFTAMHPEVADAMNNAEMLKSQSSVKFTSGVPGKLTAYTKQFRGEPFSPEVWPLVKSHMPSPGKLVNLENDRGETVYGVTTPTSLRFFTRAAEPASIRLFDRSYDHFDLTSNGNVPPAALLGFVLKNFKVNTDLLKSVANSPEVCKKSVPEVLYAIPSPEWDNFPAESNSFEKTIVQDGDTFKVAY